MMIVQKANKNNAQNTAAKGAIFLNIAFFFKVYFMVRRYFVSVFLETYQDQSLIAPYYFLVNSPFSEFLVLYFVLNIVFFHPN